MQKLGNERSSSAVSLVRAIHSASGRAAVWPEVLEGLGNHLDARAATLGHHDFASGTDSDLVVSSGSYGFAEDLTIFAARNPWFLSSNEYVTGRVLIGEELIGSCELKRTDFYRGFLRPRGLLHLLCGVVAEQPHGVHLLSLYRGEDQPPFDALAKAHFSELLDHVTISIESEWRWQAADDLVRALLALADQEAHATMLVNDEGELIYRNPAAVHVLEERFGLCLDGGRVVAASTVDRRLLGETIARAARIDPARGPAAPGVLTLACAPPLPPVVAVVRSAGLVFAREAGMRRGVAMLTVRGGHPVHDHTTCAFARQYDLTVAQSRVSALVYAGQPMSVIAKSLNVSENTVRSHLRQIFQKTDTHGQMELVHLHARICPSLP